MRKTLFIKNAAILTASSLLLRFLGIIFKVWLADAIGAEGIGLYQLVFSVYVLASTFATSGISTAVTRLAADELALGSRNGVLKIVRRCIQISLAVATVTVIILLFGADLIASRLLGDMRAALSIKILSLSLPFMGISSCIKGYFIARRKAEPSSSAQIIEQLVRIGVILLLVKHFLPLGLQFTCAAVLLGDTVAEGVSCGYVYLRYLLDRKGLSSLSGRARPPFKITKAVSHIALPISAGRYLNSGLRTIENVLVPKALSLCALSSGNALSLFGMIKGMALPLLFFPSTLLGALSTMLIPEMSEAAARGRMGLVRSAAQQIIKLTSLVGFIFGAVFFVAGRKIGILVYKSADVGFLLCALAPIVPLMYLDSVADGILKGLDLQHFTFRTSVSDSSLRILLIVLLLPRWGIYAFLGIMYFSNLLTCLLHIGKLKRVCGLSTNWLNSVIMPICFALLSVVSTNAAVSLLQIPSDLVYIILLCVISIPLYMLLLFLFKIISADDIRAFR